MVGWRALAPCGSLGAVGSKCDAIVRGPNARPFGDDSRGSGLLWRYQLLQDNKGLPPLELILVAHAPRQPAYPY